MVKATLKMSLNILRWGDYLYYLGGVSVVTMVLLRGKESQSLRERTESEVEVRHFEDGRRGHGPRKHTASRSWKRQGNRFSLRASRKNTGLPTP